MAKEKLKIEPIDDDEQDAPSVADDAGDEDDEESPSVASASKQMDASVVKSPGSKPVGTMNVGKSQSQPDGSRIDDYHKYLITPEDIQTSQEGQRKAAMVTGLANALGNQQSAGNFYLHAMNPHQDFSQLGNMIEKRADAPIQEKQAMLNQTMKQPQMELTAQLNDPGSMATKLLQANAMAALGQIKSKNPDQQQAYGDLRAQIPKMTGFQLKNVIDNDPLLKESFTASIAGQKLDQTMAMMNNRMQNQGELKAQNTVNSDKILNTYIPRLDGASKIMGLIQAGERGEFATNKSLLGQLNAEIGRLETGSQSPGLGASEKTEMNDLHATLSDLRDSVTGGVSSVDLSKKFAQAKGMVGDLAKSYYQQIDDRMDQLKSGANLPGQSDVFNNKQKTMQEIYAKRFGNVGMNIAGNGNAPPAPQGGGLIPSANAGAPQTMMKDGHTYVKVQGGWKLQGGQ